MGKDNKKPTDKQKIDVEKIDLERFKEKTADKPGTLTFPHSVGGVVIKPEDKGKSKVVQLRPCNSKLKARWTS